MLNEFWGGQINEFRFSSTRFPTNLNQRAISGNFNQFEYLMRHFYYRNSWALKPRQRSVMNNVIHSTLSCFVLPLCGGSKLAPINFRFHKTLSQRNVWRRNTKESFFLSFGPDERHTIHNANSRYQCKQEFASEFKRCLNLHRKGFKKSEAGEKWLRCA